MRKVYFYIPTLAAGGAEKQCSLVAGSLRRRGFAVCILVNDASNMALKNQKNVIGVPVIELPHRALGRLRFLVQLMRHSPGAIVFSYLASSNFYASVAGLFSKDCHVYCGIRCGRLPWWKYCLEIVNNRWLACGTIFNSHRAYRDFTARGFKASKSLVIGNAFLAGEAIDKIPHQGINIVTVGRFTFEKDYRTWLSVIRIVLDAGYPIHALIEGYGKGKNLVEGWVREMDLSGVVDFYPGDYPVDKILSQGDIFLLSSRSEGVSNAILEAMNAGVPVVATDVGDNNIMIEHGKSGFLEKVGDAMGLAGAVIKLIQDQEQRNSFGESGKRILAKEYSMAGVLGKYEDLILKG